MAARVAKRKTLMKVELDK